MRSADAITLFRIGLVFPVLYLIYLKFNPFAVVALILFTFLLDEVDGYLALGRHENFLKYIIAEGKGKHVYAPADVAKLPKYGSALDIAGDRITEFSFWILFTYLRIIPLFVLFIVVIRDALSDAFTHTSGKTFHNMHSKFGKIAYSHLARGAIGASKAVTFCYLALMYIANWPAWIGYILVAYVITFFLLRGAAEIYEAVL